MFCVSCTYLPMVLWKGYSIDRKINMDSPVFNLFGFCFQPSYTVLYIFENGATVLHIWYNGATEAQYENTFWLFPLYVGSILFWSCTWERLTFTTDHSVHMHSFTCCGQSLATASSVKKRDLKLFTVNKQIVYESICYDMHDNYREMICCCYSNNITDECCVLT